mgnify:CR=1 FL=1
MSRESFSWVMRSSAPQDAAYDYWNERAYFDEVVANYEGSILLVHGLEDWNVDPAVAIPWTQELNDTGLKVKQFLGQWAHDHPDQGAEPFKRYDWAEILLRWFDSELKGMDVDTGPAVQVQSNDGRWRDELAWPPKDAHMQAYSLGAGTMGIDTQPHAAHTPSLIEPAVWRMTVDEDLHIAGLPTVHITATPTGPSGYAGAILYDEAPDGSRERIGWTGMNFRYHAGGEEPQVVVPGTDIVLRMQLQPLDAYVPAGHTLVLEVGPALTPSDRIPAPHLYPYQLHTGEGYGPEVTLPLVQRDGSAFFEPPMP